LGEEGGVLEGLDGIDLAGLVKGDEGLGLVAELGGFPDLGRGGAGGLIDETICSAAQKSAEAAFSGGETFVAHGGGTMAKTVAARKVIFQNLWIPWKMWIDGFHFSCEYGAWFTRQSRITPSWTKEYGCKRNFLETPA
jgi:hypothetical protein